MLTVRECVHFLCNWNSGTFLYSFLLNDKADSIEISIFITKSHQSPRSCHARGMWKPLTHRGNWPQDLCCPSQILTKQFIIYRMALLKTSLIVLIVRIWSYMYLCCWFVHLSSCSHLCPPQSQQAKNVQLHRRSASSGADSLSHIAPFPDIQMTVYSR